LGVGVEAPFTSALGLQPPWVVEEVKLDMPATSIDFEVSCSGALLTCPARGAAAQPVHDRLRRKGRHLDFFQFEAWRHAGVPRVACGSCGKTTQLSGPWARPGSAFTAAFEAQALALCRDLPARQAAALLRCKDKQLGRRIEFYVDQARALESFTCVQIVGIDEPGLRRGQHCITVVRDLDAKRLLRQVQLHRNKVERVRDVTGELTLAMACSCSRGVRLGVPSR
jgi:transposase